MDKKELRAKYKALREELSLDEIDDKSLAIANTMLQLDAMPDGRKVCEKTYFHLFLTIKEQKEVETEFVLQILAGKDKEIVVAKSNFDTLEMTNYLLTDTTKFQKNKYNIYEPVNGLEVPNAKIEVVFVPLLAYDKLGNRVGYGKGFYDNFLSKCPSNIIKVGLSFFEPEETIDDVSPADIRLDYCVTPTTNYSFL